MTPGDSRWLCLWLPRWSTDRWRQARQPAERESATPLALVTAGQGGVRVTAVDALAAAEGVAVGLTLADARALLPELAIAEAAPTADRAALERLAIWAERFSPFVALDPEGDGLWLDIAGTGRLFGPPEALMAGLVERLDRMGFAGRAAVAPTPGAAWALARFGADRAVVAEGGIAAALAGLTPLALRLTADMVLELRRLGLVRLEQLYGLPRASLGARFGAVLARRLDQALGRAAEALAPHRPPPRHLARLAWPAPIGRTEDVEAAIRHLAADLCRSLERTGEGAVRLMLALHLADGQVRRLAVGCSRPSRAGEHLARLFAEKLDGLDIGFGVEAILLDATETVVLRPDDGDAAALGVLVDRLSNRLGAGAVGRLVPRASHVPERAQAWSPGLAAVAAEAMWLAGDRPRPIRLLSPPEPVEAVAEVPDGPPVSFRWRRLTHRVRRAEGPERVAPEWWRAVDPHAQADAETRDYFRVEDERGQRFWLYRDGLYGAGSSPTWYLHGLFS